MEKRIGIRYDVDARGAIDQLAKVELELNRINKEIADAKRTGKQGVYRDLREEQIKLQNTAAELRREVKQTNDEFKSQKFPKDSLVGLRQQYRALIRDINQLSTTDPRFEERAREAGELSRKINDLAKSTGSFKENIGRYEEAVTGAFEKVGAGLEGNVTALITGLGAGGAIGAILDLTGEAVAALDEMITKVNEVRLQVQQLTGETGTAADDISSRVLAIAETFDTDYNEVLIAANALTKQLTGNFEESFNLIEQGLLNGANANGEFFDSVREYPAFFREMKLSGEQFISVISQGVKEGVFSDKAPDLLKEFNLRIRELPKSTADALTTIGIDSKKLQKVITEEGVGQAFQVVQERLKQLKDDSPEVGVALADIFGGAGEDAGIQFIKTIDLSSDALARMSENTSELSQRQVEQLRVNKAYTEAQVDLARSLDGAGRQFSTLGTRIKTALIETLTDGIIKLRAIAATIRNIFNRKFVAVTPAEIIAQDVIEADKQTKNLEKSQEDLGKTTKKVTDQLNNISNAAGKAAETGIAKMRTELQGLKKDFDSAASPEAAAKIADQIDAIELKITQAAAKVQRIRDAQGGINSVLSTLPSAANIGGLAEAQQEEATRQRLQVIISTLDLENRARIENEQDVQEILQGIQRDGIEKIQEQRRQALEKGVEDEQEFLKAQQEITADAVESAGALFGSFINDTENTFKDFLKQLIVIALEFFEKQVLLSIAQAQAASLASPESVATFGAAGLAKGALLAGLIKGIFAAVKSQIQNFAFGGEVLPALAAGVIRSRPNIPATRHGDNVLATVRTGEMILNRKQQNLAEWMFGRDVWRRLGVPGFPTGGLVTPTLVNPNAFAGAAGGQQVALSEESLALQAEIIARRVAAEVSITVGEAIYQADLRREKTKKLNNEIQT